MRLPENSLVTGHAGHQIFVVRGGVAHWVPDTWTMHALGLSPRDLLILEDADLDRLPIGGAVPTEVPSPRLPDGTVVQTESGTWVACGWLLDPVTDPAELRAAAYDGSRAVVWLPDSIVRGARRRRAQKYP